MRTLHEAESILLITLGLLLFGGVLLAYEYGFLGFPAVNQLSASIITTPTGRIITEDIRLTTPTTLTFTYPASWNISLTCPDTPRQELTQDGNRKYTCRAKHVRLSMLIPQQEGVILLPGGLPVHTLLIDDGTRYTASYLPRGMPITYTLPYTPPSSPFPRHAFFAFVLSVLPAIFWYAYGREKPAGSIGLLKAPPRDDRMPWELDVLVHHTLTPRGLMATLHWLHREGLITYRGTIPLQGKTAYLFAIREGPAEGLARVIYETLSKPDGEQIIYISRESDHDLIAFLPEDRVIGSTRLRRFAEEAEAFIHHLQDTYYRQARPLFAFLIISLLSSAFILLILHQLQEALMLFGYSSLYTLIYALSPPSLFRSFHEEYYHEFIEWLSFRAFLNTPHDVLNTPYIHHVNHHQWFEYSLVLGVERTWLSILRSIHEDILTEEYEAFIRDCHPITLSLGKSLFRRLSDIEDVFLR